MKDDDDSDGYQSKGWVLLVVLMMVIVAGWIVVYPWLHPEVNRKDDSPIPSYSHV